MKTPHVSRLLSCLCLGLALAVAAQEATGLRLRGTVAAVVGTAAGDTLRGASQGGEPAPVGIAASESYTLFSGSRLSGEMQDILQYTLSAGWHMLGAPGRSDTALGGIFVGRAGAAIKVGPVQYYDHERLRYVGAGNDAPLLPRQGFWLFSHWGGQSRVFTVSERIAAGAWLKEIPFGAWVLYSPPGKIVLPAESGLTVFGWDSQLQAYHPLVAGDTIEPLRGYWVYRQGE